MVILSVIYFFLIICESLVWQERKSSLRNYLLLYESIFLISVFFFIFYPFAVYSSKKESNLNCGVHICIVWLLQKR